MPAEYADIQIPYQLALTRVEGPFYFGTGNIPFGKRFSQTIGAETDTNNPQILSDLASAADNGSWKIAIDNLNPADEPDTMGSILYASARATGSNEIILVLAQPDKLARIHQGYVKYLSERNPVPEDPAGIGYRGPYMLEISNSESGADPYMPISSAHRIVLTDTESFKRINWDECEPKRTIAATITIGLNRYYSQALIRNNPLFVNTMTVEINGTDKPETLQENINFRRPMHVQAPVTANRWDQQRGPKRPITKNPIPTTMRERVGFIAQNYQFIATNPGILSETEEKVLAVIREHPDWTSYQIASGSGLKHHQNAASTILQIAKKVQRLKDGKTVDTNTQLSAKSTAIRTGMPRGGLKNLNEKQRKVARAVIDHDFPTVKALAAYIKMNPKTVAVILDKIYKALPTSQRS